MTERDKASRPSRTSEHRADDLAAADDQYQLGVDFFREGLPGGPAVVDHLYPEGLASTLRALSSASPTPEAVSIEDLAPHRDSDKRGWSDVSDSVAGLVNSAIANIPALLIVGCGVGLSLWTAYVGSQRRLTDLEVGLLQALALGLSLSGTFWVGRQSARQAAKDLIRPHARSAFRRLLSLYGGLGRLRQSIAQRQLSLDSLSAEGKVALTHVRSELEILTAQVVEQIGTSNDAMEDWRDLVPEEVAALEELQRIREQTTRHEQ